MDALLAKAAALLAAAGLSCTDPEVQVKPDLKIGTQEIAGAYLGRTGTGGRHLIWLNGKYWSWYGEQQRLHVLLHEQVHCARYEHNERYGIRQPGALDKREEDLTESTTRALLLRDG